MGNHDLEVINPDLVHEDASVSPWEIELINWCVAQLSEADISFIRSFEPWIEIPLNGEASLMCVHGSPGSPLDQILATTPVGELDEMLDGLAATVMVGGHTHIQMLRQHKGTMIVNSGSAGFPLEQMPFEGPPRYLPWAEYAVIDWTNGALGVELRRVPVDLGQIKEVALSSGMPRAVAWLDLWRTPEEEGH
jgi:predicted phosphodiesterase